MDLFSHLQRLTMDFYDNRESGKILSVLLADILMIRLTHTEICIKIFDIY